MCSFNGEKYIRQQLDSILKQKRRVDELIICDDHSTDQTVSIIHSVLDESPINWRLFQNPQNLGFIKNFEQCIHLCKGDIVLFCDQVDYWLDNKTQKFEEVFEKNPLCILAFSDAELVDKNLQSLGSNLWSTKRFKGLKNKTNSIMMLDLFLQKHFIYGCTMAIRKDFYSSEISTSRDCDQFILITFVGFLCYNARIYTLFDNFSCYNQYI